MGSTRPIVPDRIRHVLPPHGQHIYESAFHNAWTRYKEDEVAHRVAWNAVKRVYERSDKGVWVVKKEKQVRTSEEVIEDHLRLRREGKWEEDIKNNYAKNCVILSSFGIFRRHSGAKKSALLLQKHLPDGTFEYKNVIVQDSIGFLEWKAQSKTAHVADGADSFYVQKGRIQIQTVHYTPSPE